MPGSPTHSPTRSDEDDLAPLELPPLDGEGTDENAVTDDPDLVLAEINDALENALDDENGEGDPIDFEGDGEEGSLLEGSEEAGMDVASFDLALGGETASLLDDDDVEGDGDDEELAIDEERTIADGGEDGPLEADDSIREEDLPALDADDEGDVPDDVLFESGMMSVSPAEDELRWDDRAWAKAPGPDVSAFDHEESGIIAVPSDDKDNARDVAWKALDDAGRVTAATFVPGGSVVIALSKLDDTERVVLVRIVPTGDARIIAEIDGGEESERANVASLRWDAAHGLIVAFGSFGAQAFRPA